MRTSSALDHQPCRGRTRCRRAFGAALLTSALLALSLPALGQRPDTRDIDAYLHAITRPPGSRRAAALEAFASSPSTSSLKLDALQWIVWEERRSHNYAAAVTWARRLLTADPGNALALAINAAAARQASQPPSSYGALARRGLLSMARLRRPEGMSHAEYVQLRRQVEGMLWAADGYAALAGREYAAARASLGKAVALSPDDPHLVYTLALADLSGEKPDRAQGYWLLAKAVNLFGGPSAAREIAEFGRARYKQDGGTDRDWDQFLATTASPGASAATVIAGETAGRMANAVTDKRRTAKSQPREIANVRAPAHPSKMVWKGEREPPPDAEATSLPPLSADLPARKPHPGPPVSLGILIETALTRKATRQAIVDSLGDLVRHLGPDDEVFILSFSHDLVFEQDLTGNARRLQSAMEQIKPHPGTALLDAVAFSAGHLRRIAANDNRVLLVISDGRNSNSRYPLLASSNEIRASGVRIYCIGVGVGARESMVRLQALATGTGGAASFVTAPDQFRAAARQVAGSIGIPLQY